MKWMKDRSELRSDPKSLWPEVQSIIILGSNYHYNCNSLELLNKKNHGIISVYARGQDYHKTIKKKLKHMSAVLVKKFQCNLKYFVDTAPVMEKPLAMNAGLGWIGKHTNLVSQEFGSWLFLSSIFLNINFDTFESEQDHCGSCSQCINVCPTNAIIEPYKLDARKCISYLTIEHKSHVDKEYRKLIGNRIFGCDDCLAVCPWNKFAKESNDINFKPRNGLEEPALISLVNMDTSTFQDKFKGSGIKRIGRDRFVRNVLIAIGNSGNKDFTKSILRLLKDNSPLVRAMAVWALKEINGKEEFEAFKRNNFNQEDDIDVKNEWIN